MEWLSDGCLDFLVDCLMDLLIVVLINLHLFIHSFIKHCTCNFKIASHSPTFSFCDLTCMTKQNHFTIELIRFDLRWGGLHESWLYFHIFLLFLIHPISDEISCMRNLCFLASHLLTKIERGDLSREVLISWWPQFQRLESVIQWNRSLSS